MQLPPGLKITVFEAFSNFQPKVMVNEHLSAHVPLLWCVSVLCVGNWLYACEWDQKTILDFVKQNLA